MLLNNLNVNKYHYFHEFVIRPCFVKIFQIRHFQEWLHHWNASGYASTKEGSSSFAKVRRRLLRGHVAQPFDLKKSMKYLLSTLASHTPFLYLLQPNFWQYNLQSLNAFEQQALHTSLRVQIANRSCCDNAALVSITTIAKTIAIESSFIPDIPI